MKESLLISSPSEGSLLVVGSNTRVERIAPILYAMDWKIYTGKLNELNEEALRTGSHKPYVMLRAGKFPSSLIEKTVDNG